jgi:hypothetical protein
VNFLQKGAIHEKDDIREAFGCCGPSGGVCIWDYSRWMLPMQQYSRVSQSRGVHVDELWKLL